MSEDLIIKCLIAFIIGWLVSRMMGNGFSVGIQQMNDDNCDNNNECWTNYNNCPYFDDEGITLSPELAKLKCMCEVYNCQCNTCNNCSDFNKKCIIKNGIIDVKRPIPTADIWDEILVDTCTSELKYQNRRTSMMENTVENIINYWGGRVINKDDPENINNKNDE